MMEFGNVFVNKSLLADTKQVFLKLFFLVEISKNSFDNRSKSYNDTKNNATLLNYNSKASFNYILIKKIIVKS